MAHYIQLDDFVQSPEGRVFMQRVRTAIKIAAQAIVDQAILDIAAGDQPTLDAAKGDRIWAQVFLRDTTNVHETARVTNILLADNKSKTIQEIIDLTDNNIKNRVDAITPFLIQSRQDR